MAIRVEPYDFNAVNKLKISEETAIPPPEVISYLNKLIKDNNLETYVAPTLLHRHYTLLKNQIIVEQNGDKTWTERTTAPEEVRSYPPTDPKVILPTVYQCKYSSSEKSLMPLEFAINPKNDDNLDDATNALLAETSFIKSYIDFLNEKGCINTVGIGLIRDIHTKAIEKQLNLLEVEFKNSDDTVKSQVLRLYTQAEWETLVEKFPSTTITETMWISYGYESNASSEATLKSGDATATGQVTTKCGMNHFAGILNYLNN